MELFPLFGFIDLKTLLLIGHVGGVALGAGVAFFSALIFTKVMYDGVVTKNEMTLLEAASSVVSVGLTLIVLTGIGMFMLNQEGYLASSKFLVKMTVVAVLILNGVLIHTLHIKALKKHIGTYLPNVPGFVMRSYAMYAGGAISMTSWATALILGVFRGVPYSYQQILLVYLAVLVGAIALALCLHFFTFAKKKR